MEAGGFEINFPEQIKNIVLNEFYAKMAETEIESLKLKKILTIYNQNGVSSETALKILRDQAIAVAEIENLYGGGETNG